MRDYKSQGDLTVLDGTEAATGGSGGCLTFSTKDRSETPSLSPFWTAKDTMNLVRFEMTGSWYNTTTPDEPLSVKLKTSDYATLVEFTISEDGPVHLVWTGSLPIESGTALQLTCEGGGVFYWVGPLPENGYWNAAESVDLVISAWFDGSAGGGLIIYPMPLVG